MTSDEKMKEIEEDLAEHLAHVGFGPISKNQKWLISRVKELTQAIEKTEGRNSCPKCRMTDEILFDVLVGSKPK